MQSTRFGGTFSSIEYEVVGEQLRLGPLISSSPIEFLSGVDLPYQDIDLHIYTQIISFSLCTVAGSFKLKYSLRPTIKR